MPRYFVSGLILAALCAADARAFAQDEPMPPIADVIPTGLEKHGHLRTDNYYWLNQRDNPQVIRYLEAENAYMESQMAPTEQLRESLFEETKGRIKQTDQSVPYADRGFVYFSRTEEGRQYPVYCRHPDQEGAATEIMLDVNELAEGKPFCSVAGVAVSSGTNILAFAVDFVGRRKYTVHFKDLESGKMLPDVIEDVTGNMVWAEDNQTLFYTRQDPVTLRSYQVFRHRLGEDSQSDPLVFQEDDEEFACGVGKSRSREFIFIGSRQTLSSEYRILDAREPDGEFAVFSPREPDHEYSIDHLDDHFYILTNWDAKNFRLMMTPETETDKSSWNELVAHDQHQLLSNFELFADFLVLQTRRDGLTTIRIRPWESAAQEFELPFDDPTYLAMATPTPDPDTTWLRYAYSSLTTPPSVYEFDMRSREKRLLKQDEILGGFDSANYRSRREWATARDGTKVPVSIVFHKDTAVDGTAPCLQYGYGSYGASMDARFDSTRLNLLDRGFVFAIAHIRGGEELGRHWYEDGKLLKKKNTFTDFIDVGEFLIRSGYADPKRLYAHGGSAGGLLIGAVVNLRPDLYHGVIADVPFVDVVTTMLDDSIPLTTGEYDEWGNPNEKEYYDYMLSYSPYDNVEAKTYPNMLVTTGLHDSQVQYFEPAKWVAKLRRYKTGDNLLLLKTNMQAGHGGASGRYDRYKEIAFRHAFLLMLAGINQ